MDTIVSRYQEYLFRTYQPLPELNKWVETLSPQGQWPDIPYDDHEPANWKVSRHLERVRELALAWATPKALHYQQKELWQKLSVALDHWLKKRYKNSNWWHNQIGVPRYMRDIIVLSRSGLTPQQLKQALEVLGQFRLMGNGGGANLIWCADLGLHHGALTANEELVIRCSKLIIDEIRIYNGEGIQPDYSFHQHSKRLQMYQYGKAFLWETARLAWQLRGTSLAFPEEKVEILMNFVLEGWQWMARGIHTVPGTMDRSASRVGELRSPDLRPLIPFMMELRPENASALEHMMRIQNGEAALKGYRYYPYADFSAFHRPDFTFFLKTISTRTLPTESFNGENLKGKLLNSGDGYLIRNGEEYFNLMPVWDWTALPGVTAFKKAHKIDQRSFAGSVSDGISGLTAMDYSLTDETQEQVVSARKVWACHEDLVVCLISDLSGEHIANDVYTAMDQCRWQGPVTVNRPGNTVMAGSHQLKNVKWIHHAGFAYMPLYDAPVALHLKEVTDSWKSVNTSQPGEPVTEKIFMPVLEHGRTLRGKNTGYAMAYVASPRQAMKIAARPSWKIERNDKDCQAVSFQDGTLMAAFFMPAALKNKAHDIEVDKPCLVLLRDNKLFVTDPQHSGATITIKWNGKVTEVTLPLQGETEEVNFVNTP